MEQADLADYDFRTLSPSDFELLIRDLLWAEHQWRLEAFGHGRDGGVDLRARTQNGKVVVQCKHYIGSSFADLRSSARREVPKMNTEKPDKYIFATSQDLNRTQKDKLAEDLSPWLSEPADLLTRIDINALLDRHPQVEQQHFKLWLASTNILERIVHSGIWERSEALLENIRDRVKLYVRTESYLKSLNLLEKKHVAVLVGPPGVGKSMLAEMLALNYWHKGWQIVKIERDIDEGWSAHKASGKQVFLYDDFLGQTDVSERRERNDSSIVHFMDRVARNPEKRLVMTSRSQILKQTALMSEPVARTDFQVIQCVLQISEYGPVQRARMLYNHLYFSTLPREVVKQYSAESEYWRVVNHKNFSPRIIELIIKRSYSSASELSEALIHTLDHPMDLWGIIFNNSLSDVAQRIVLILVSFPVEGVSTDQLKRLTLGDSKPIEYTSALKILEGTFIHLERSNYSYEISVSYANPSVRDFVLAFLNQEPDYLITLLKEASNLSQIHILLEYAIAESNGKLKFPGYAQAITRHQLDISLRIIELFSTVAAAERARVKTDRSTIFIDRFTSHLLASLRPILRLMKDSFDRIFAEVNEYFDAAPNVYMNADDWRHYNEALCVRNRGSLAQIGDKFRWSFEEWGNRLYSLDEVREYKDFFDAHGTAFKHHIPDIEATFTQYSIAGLRGELEAIDQNHEDEAADHYLVDQVKIMAVEMGLMGDLQDDIESAHSSIEFHYEDRDDDDPYLKANSGGESWPSNDPQISASERVTIDGMFRELS